MNQSCQIEHGASDSDVGTPCSNRAVATCADCGAAICSDCRMWCCGQSFCQWCGDYHTTLYLNLKPSVSDGGRSHLGDGYPSAGFFKRGGFSTSLTTSVSSSVFAILSKTLLCDRRVGSPTDALSFDNFVHTQPNGSALFRHVGGVDPPDISPITMDHDDLFELPPFGEAGGLFSHPVTALAGPLLKSGIPAWASPLCRSFPRRQNSS